MFTPCSITVRPLASVIQRPSCESGGVGAVAAAGTAQTAAHSAMATIALRITENRLVKEGGPGIGIPPPFERRLCRAEADKVTARSRRGGFGDFRHRLDVRAREAADDDDVEGFVSAELGLS